MFSYKGYRSVTVLLYYLKRKDGLGGIFSDMKCLLVRQT